MKYIFLIAAFNAFFFVFLLLQKKKAFHDKILIVWLLYLGLFTGTYGLFSDELFTGYPVLSASFISFLLLHGPFLYLYIRSLTDADFKISLRDIIHFLPFLLFNLYLLIGPVATGNSEGISLDHPESAGNAPWLFNFFLLLTALSGPVYFILSYRVFKTLDTDISNNFSTSENIDLDWLRKLVYSFGIIWTIFILFATIHHILHFFTWSFCTDGLFLSLSLFIILIGYFGLKQREIFVHYPEQKIEYVTETKARYAGNPLNETDASVILSRIKEYMEKEKPYLEAELSLPNLAEKLDVPAHVLSRVINERLGVNFFDFINQYRVEEVKLKLSNPQFNNLTLLGIAFESGFNTK